MKDFRNLKKPLIIIVGCVAQAESDEMIKREPYIDMVIGPQSYHKIRDLILVYERKKEKVNETEFDVIRKFDELQKIPNLQNKISSYITIQEGCDKFCHFCVVPYTRGPEYSRPLKQIIDEAHNLVESENRLRELQNILENFQCENHKSYLQQDCEVLVENKLNKQERYFGRNKYMTPVIFESDNCKTGDLINVKIVSFNQKNLFGFHKINKMKAA